MPIEMFRWLGLRVAGSDTLVWLDRVWIASLALSFLGLFTRGSTLVAFVLGFYLLGLPHNFGKTNHYDAILILTLLAMAVARCADAWSLDRLVVMRRHRPAAAVRASAEYTWPVRLVWVLMALVFFSAGVSKLRESGFDWFLSDNMHYVLLRHHYSHFALTGLAPVFAQYATLTKLVAAGSLILELCAPLALISRRLRAVIVPSLLLMQTGIWALLGVAFGQFLAAYAFWVPWDRIARRVAVLLGRKDPVAILHEGI
jgi:hypothetical protein